MNPKAQLQRVSPTPMLCNLWSICMCSSFGNSSRYVKEGLLQDNFICNMVSWEIMEIKHSKSICVHVEAKTMRGASWTLHGHVANYVQENVLHVYMQPAFINVWTLVCLQLQLRQSAPLKKEEALAYLCPSMRNELLGFEGKKKN